MYVIVAGGGRVGYHLTRALLAEGHEAVLLELDRARARQLSEELGSVVIGHRADEGRWLLEAGVLRADVVIAVTGEDADNLVICQLAGLLCRRHGVKPPRTIARVTDPGNEAIMRRLGVDATVSATSVIMGLIEQEMPPHPVVHLLPLREAGIELVEFSVAAGSPAAGQRLGELRVGPGCSFALIVRHGQALRPTADTVLQPEDAIIALTTQQEQTRLRELLVGPVA